MNSDKPTDEALAEVVALLKRCLESRDQFIVSRGLWSDYTDSLPVDRAAIRRPAPVGVELVAKVISDMVSGPQLRDDHLRALHEQDKLAAARTILTAARAQRDAEIVAWLRLQCTDDPVNGEELANDLVYAIERGEVPHG